MIPEPQRTYVLELLAALGPAAGEFVIAGAQAIKFGVKDARGTKDVDFILDVIALRAEPILLNAVLEQLGYTAVEGARNFQFEKPIPNSAETMRIEFMAPEEFKRSSDFRVDVQQGIHARACTGGTENPAGIESSIRTMKWSPFSFKDVENQWSIATAVALQKVTNVPYFSDWFRDRICR